MSLLRSIDCSRDQAVFFADRILLIWPSICAPDMQERHLISVAGIALKLRKSKVSMRFDFVFVVSTLVHMKFE